MTESLIHGRTMPREFASTMTVARIEMAGAMVNTALDMTVFFSFSVDIPSFLPCFHALMRKNSDCAMTKTTMKRPSPIIKPFSLKFSGTTKTPPISFQRINSLRMISYRNAVRQEKSKIYCKKCAITTLLLFSVCVNIKASIYKNFICNILKLVHTFPPFCSTFHLSA